MSERDASGALSDAPVGWPGWVERVGALWLAARVALLALALPPRLRHTPAVRVAARLAPHCVPATRRARALAATTWLADRLVNRLPWQYGGHCVRRSLLLYYAATRCGYPAQIVFGVRREGDGLTGHAWLELDHQPFLEQLADPHQAYIEMQRWPPLAPTDDRE
jgi:transglutaminase superfamily protein